jgi:hypothetical protein
MMLNGKQIRLGIFKMNIRLVRAVFLFVLAMSLAFALRETLMVLGL